MDSCNRSLVHFRSLKIRVAHTHSRWQRRRAHCLLLWTSSIKYIIFEWRWYNISYIWVEVHNSLSGVVARDQWVYLITLSASCIASRRTWACEARLRGKTDQLQRWSEANPCIPQHILTISFPQVTSQIKRWSQGGWKNVLNQSVF